MSHSRIVFATTLLLSWVTNSGADETLTRLRACGGSACTSGTATALAVGGKYWNAGNEGVKLLATPFENPISILNVKPIDGKPLTNHGLSHLAAAQKSRVIRFYRDSINDEGLRHLVEALNANENRHRQIELRYAQVTDAGVEHLKRLKAIDRVKVYRTAVTPAGHDRLLRSLPDCKVEYVPGKDFAVVTASQGELSN